MFFKNFNFQNISLQKKVFKAESFKVEDWNVSYLTSSSKKLSQFTRMLYNNVELFVQQQFPYWQQLWFIFHLIFFSKHLKLIGIKFTVYEGSTKADFTLPKNFLFYADPFSTAERERVIFFLISQKSLIDILHDLFHQYICLLIFTNTTFFNLRHKPPGQSLYHSSQSPIPQTLILHHLIQILEFENETCTSKWNKIFRV